MKVYRSKARSWHMFLYPCADCPYCAWCGVCSLFSFLDQILQICCARELMFLVDLCVCGCQFDGDLVSAFGSFSKELFVDWLTLLLQPRTCRGTGFPHRVHDVHRAVTTGRVIIIRLGAWCLVAGAGGGNQAKPAVIHTYSLTVSSGRVFLCPPTTI